FEVEDAPKVIRAYDRYITNAPRQLGAFFAWQIAPPLPFIPEERHGDTFCAMVVCWTGKPAEAKKAFAPFREAAPTVAEWVAPMPYPALNGAFDGLVPPGIQHYWKAVFVRELTDDAIEAHLEHGPKIPVVNSTMHIYPINGAVHDVPADATAFGHRNAKFATVVAGMWPDPAQNKANTKWVRDYYAALAPHSEKGGYVNFAAGDDADRVGASYVRGFDPTQREVPQDVAERGADHPHEEGESQAVPADLDGQGPRCDDLGDGNKDQAKAREDEERVECVRPGISPGTSVRGVESPGRAGHGHQSDPRKRHLPDSAERDDRNSCEGQDLAHDRPRRGGLPVMNDAEESHCQDHESVEYEGSGSGRNELVAEGNRERVEAKQDSPNQVRPTSKGTGEGAREGHSQEEQHPESAHESNDRQ